ncbi:ribosome silencing factor [Herminiimonas sp. CN]|uniref:ribosome silencing factor n=1 Tax=Herminiimonas sp. CN TaxID=1349818 RepID=UPI0004739EE7|nr:ribosome silencing factor [Herminiimonas sp. CN]
MELKKLQTLVIDALEDVKAQDINVFDTVHLTSLFDRIVIASGTSNRQTKALAASVRDKVKAAGGEVLSMEGEDTGEWVLVDLGDIIVHIMQPTIRAYYRLEEIWGDKEVKFGAAKRTAKKTDDAAEAPKRAVSRHLAASQTTVDDAPAAKKPSTRKPAAKTGAEPAKKRAAKPPVGKTVKVAASKSAASAKKAPAKRAPRAKAAS